MSWDGHIPDEKLIEWINRAEIDSESRKDGLTAQLILELRTLKQYRSMVRESPERRFMVKRKSSKGSYAVALQENRFVDFLAWAIAHVNNPTLRHPFCPFCCSDKLAADESALRSLGWRDQYSGELS